MKRLALALAVAATLSACVTANPDMVRRENTMRMSTVQDATILSMRPVVVDGSQSGAGAVAGGVVGSVAGSSIGGRRDGFVGGVIGAVAGAVVGNAIERSATREEAYEIVVQMRNGERRSIVQARGSEILNVGDPVVVVSDGRQTRISRAPVPGQRMAPQQPMAPQPAPSSNTAPAPVYTPR